MHSARLVSSVQHSESKWVNMNDLPCVSELCYEKRGEKGSAMH